MSESSSDGWRFPGRPPSIGSTPALFEHASRPMAAVGGGEEPHVEVVNRAYLERFEGRPPEESDGGSFRTHVALPRAERELVRTAAEELDDEAIVERDTADGRRRFAVRAIPVERVGLTAFLQYEEVTAELIRDQQLAVMQRVLRHDLRNDLTVLLGYAETIAESADDPEIRDHAAAMIAAASDLRSVASSAGRMRRIGEATESIALIDAVSKARREVAADANDTPSGEVSVSGEVPTGTVDRRIAVALEELCLTLVGQGDATAIDVAVDFADGWATVSLDANATLCEQERAALEGHMETKLRHATGISPWIAQWAVRAAGGRLHVEPGEGGCTILVAAPILDSAPSSRSGSDHHAGPQSQLDD